MQQAIENKLKFGLKALALDLSNEQLTQLSAYLLLMIKWNKVHNLTAIREPMDMVTLHILDSLAVLAYVKKMSANNLLDVGAGAGLPSIPLAICLPELPIVAIDAVQKKVSFMRQVKGELNLPNFSVEVGRVEALKINKYRDGLGFDLIISRAFSEISLFLKLTQHLIAANGQWLAMKGLVPQHEFDKALVKPAEIINLNVPELAAERHLIIFKNTKEMGMTF